MQSNADASILSGNGLNPTTIHQGIFGFNGRNLLQSVKVGALCGSLAPYTHCQLFLRSSMRGKMLPLHANCTASWLAHHLRGMSLKWCLVQGAADASIAAGYINPTTVRKAVLGFNSGRNLLQDPTVKSNADASILSGNGLLNPTVVREGLFGFNGGRTLLQDPTVKVALPLTVS